MQTCKVIESAATECLRRRRLSQMDFVQERSLCVKSITVPRPAGPMPTRSQASARNWRSACLRCGGMHAGWPETRREPTLFDDIELQPQPQPSDPVDEAIEEIRRSDEVHEDEVSTPRE